MTTATNAMDDELDRSWRRYTGTEEFHRDMAELMARMRPDWSMKLKDGTVIRAELAPTMVSFDDPYSGCRCTFNRTVAADDFRRVARSMALAVLCDRFLRAREAPPQ